MSGAEYAVAKGLSACLYLSFCPTVTVVYCIEMAEYIVKQLMLNPIPLLRPVHIAATELS